MDKLNRFVDFFLDDGHLSERSQKILGIFFLLVACAMTYPQYTAKVAFVFGDSFRIYPKGLSTLLGVLFLSPLYLRGLFEWRPSVYSVLQFLLLLYVFSTFFQIILPGSTLNAVLVILVVVIALAWLGIRDVAKFLWILLAAVAIFQLLKKSDAMHINGFVFIASSVLGISFTGRVSPGGLIEGVKSEYVGLGAIGRKGIHVERS